eukprot:353090-Rhodomonas_salina.3
MHAYRRPMQPGLKGAGTIQTSVSRRECVRADVCAVQYTPKSNTRNHNFRTICTRIASAAFAPGGGHVCAVSVPHDSQQCALLQYHTTHSGVRYCSIVQRTAVCTVAVPHSA